MFGYLASDRDPFRTKSVAKINPDSGIPIKLLQGSSPQTEHFDIAFKKFLWYHNVQFVVVDPVLTWRALRADKDTSVVSLNAIFSTYSKSKTHALL